MGEPLKSKSKTAPLSVSMVPALSEAGVSVSVVGTGNYGRALVSKLTSCGVATMWGSRSPDPLSTPVQVPVEQAMLGSSVIILAVPVFSWSHLPLASLQPGTIVIDCSNRLQWCSDADQSQAETLQQLLPPGVNVVKCLNTVSAYELENQSFSAGKQVRQQKSSIYFCKNPLLGSHCWQ